MTFKMGFGGMSKFLNDFLISLCNNTHGHLSMIKLLAFGTEDELSSQHSMRLVYKDTASNWIYVNQPRRFDHCVPQRRNMGCYSGFRQ